MKGFKHLTDREFTSPREGRAEVVQSPMKRRVAGDGERDGRRGPLEAHVRDEMSCTGRWR
jgi:hypothetical protein